MAVHPPLKRREKSQCRFESYFLNKIAKSSNAGLHPLKVQDVGSSPTLATNILPSRLTAGLEALDFKM